MSETQVAVVMAALGHVQRLRLWQILLPHGNHGLPAGALASRAAILPSTLSFHLRQMSQAGVLVKRRRSRQIIYAINLDVGRAVQNFFQPDYQSNEADRMSNHASHVLGNG